MCVCTQWREREWRVVHSFLLMAAAQSSFEDLYDTDTRRGGRGGVRGEKLHPVAAGLVDALGLRPHPEGGFFVETYRGGCGRHEDLPRKPGETEAFGECIDAAVLPRWKREGGEGENMSGSERGGEVVRNTISAIHWLMTEPVLWWCENLSDHVHVFNGGDAIRYHILHACGSYEVQTCGGDPSKGHRFQVVVPGGAWKAAELIGNFCLITECVSPGWDFRDFRFISHEEFNERLSVCPTPPSSLDREAVTRLVRQQHVQQGHGNGDST